MDIFLIMQNFRNVPIFSHPICSLFLILQMVNNFTISKKGTNILYETCFNIFQLLKNQPHVIDLHLLIVKSLFCNIPVRKIFLGGVNFEAESTFHICQISPGIIPHFCFQYSNDVIIDHKLIQVGAELERIAIFKSGIHRGSYCFHYCFLIVMLVHQVVANVLFFFFTELPNEFTHRIMGLCLHRLHDFVNNFLKLVRPNASSLILQLKTKDI
jgi:hypothetical protein